MLVTLTLPFYGERFLLLKSEFPFSILREHEAQCNVISKQDEDYTVDVHSELQE